MLVVPGSPGKDTCDGVTRRDLLRVGGSAILGLSLADLFRLAGPGQRKSEAGRPRLRQGQERHPHLPPGRPQPPRPVGPQGQRAGQRPQRLQGHRHQAARRASSPNCCRSWPQVNDKFTHDPLDELHARRAVQPHRRHLPDADRLHGRQGQPVGPARTAQPQGLPQRRLATSSSSSRRPCRCCRSS